MNQFNSLSKLQKEELTQILTDAFLTRQDLRSKQDIQGFKESIQGKPNSAKSGVEELFSENPELANDVYSTLGFNTINVSEITYTDEDGNPCAKMQ